MALAGMQHARERLGAGTRRWTSWPSTASWATTGDLPGLAVVLLQPSGLPGVGKRVEGGDVRSLVVRGGRGETSIDLVSHHRGEHVEHLVPGIAVRGQAQRSQPDLRRIGLEDLMRHDIVQDEVGVEVHVGGMQGVPGGSEPGMLDRHQLSEASNPSGSPASAVGNSQADRWAHAVRQRRSDQQRAGEERVIDSVQPHDQGFARSEILERHLVGRRAPCDSQEPGRLADPRLGELPLVGWQERATLVDEAPDRAVLGQSATRPPVVPRGSGRPMAERRYGSVVQTCLHTGTFGRYDRVTGMKPPVPTGSPGRVWRERTAAADPDLEQVGDPRAPAPRGPRSRRGQSGHICVCRSLASGGPSRGDAGEIS
jgi:hypothetical protein